MTYFTMHGSDAHCIFYIINDISHRFSLLHFYSCQSQIPAVFAICLRSGSTCPPTTDINIYSACIFDFTGYPIGILYPIPYWRLPGRLRCFTTEKIHSRFLWYIFLRGGHLRAKKVLWTQISRIHSTPTYLFNTIIIMTMLSLLLFSLTLTGKRYIRPDDDSTKFHMEVLFPSTRPFWSGSQVWCNRKTETYLLHFFSTDFFLSISGRVF